MQILIYGFKPYAAYQDNITEQVIDALPDKHDIEKRVFGVKFDYQMFYTSFEEVAPDIIIGMGQHPRARKIRIERKARNRMKPSPGRIRIIKAGAPKARYANLTLPTSPMTTLAYDAGTYVCNFSMFIMGEYSDKAGCRFGFIHVPIDMDHNLVKRYVIHCCEILRNKPV